jgi:molybdopterin/thiamine biosynthesis adenylyltransferase
MSASPPASSADPIREMRAPATPTSELVRQLDHASRMPRLLGVETDIGARLGSLLVVVVGLGGVGRACSDYLARAGVNLCLVDDDHISKTSLLTHSGCYPDEIGLPKAESAARRAKTLHPRGEIYYSNGPLSDVPRNVLASADYVLLAGDNLSVEVEASEIALQVGRPLFQGSLLGTTLSAQVRALEPGPGRACGLCMMGPVDLADLQRHTQFSCAGRPARNAEVLPPTRTLPHLPALAAGLTVNELIRHALGIGEPHGGELIDLCAYSYSLARTAIPYREDCPLDHSPARVVALRDLAQCTPRMLAKQSGYTPLALATLSVESLTFDRWVRCGCGESPRPLARFRPSDAKPERCSGCGHVPVPEPLASYPEVPLDVLWDVLDLSLADLGARAPASVRVRGALATTLFVTPFFRA